MPDIAKNVSAAEPLAESVSFAALRHRDFRRYFVFNLLSMMADNIEHVITYWLLYQTFQSPLLGGFAVISHWTPFLLFSVYFGALADRYDCRKVIQIAQIMYMVVSFIWGVLFLTGTIQLWHACVLLVIHGMAGVLWSPGSQLIIHDIVGGDRLQSAIRLNATSRQLGILLGPAVGGGLMLALGPSNGLFVNAALYLPLSIWLLRVPYTGHREKRAAGRRPALSFTDAINVIREASTNRTILAMVLLGGATSLLVGNAFQAQMPEFAHDLGTDKQGIAYSVLLAANAGGAVLGGFLLEGKALLRPSARTATICAIIWCVLIAGFAASTSYPLALFLLFAAGVVNLAFLSMAQTLVQLLAPAHLRGRLIGLFAMSSFGLRAFSGVTVGVVGALIGVHWSLALSALALAAVTIGLLAFARRSSADYS
ncbi:MAG TPA: MFS transporter [Verrucomicrobiae bacterium]|nr:MFS transporter [Verrucomicrobiae bacterium]